MTLPTRAKRNKRDRQKLERLVKGRKLAFAILDARFELSRVGIGAGPQSKPGRVKKRSADLQQKIEESEKQLIELGFEIESTLASAVEYRKHLRKEAQGPQPVTSGGVGTYHLGQRPKHWK